MNPRTVNLALVLISVGVALALGEIVLQVFANTKNAHVQFSYASYTEEERNSAEGRYTLKTGKACLSVTDEQWWHPYYAWNTVKLDTVCARALFAKNRCSLVFLGGSVMANAYAPNYRTTIDEYVHQHLHGDWHSLNLAESGVRSTSEMIRFLLQVIDLKPQSVVFLDGYNEFMAIQYQGGEPEEEFYWTANIKSRVHQPLHNIVERMIDRSKLLEIALVRTGIVRSPRIAQRPSSDDIIRAAQLYVDNTLKTRILCETYHIRCHFFLQPTLVQKSVKSPEEVLLFEEQTRVFPGVKDSIEQGYQYIRNHTGQAIVDLSRIIDVDDTVFIDLVHVNKTGNRLIAERIAHELQTVECSVN